MAYPGKTIAVEECRLPLCGGDQSRLVEIATLYLRATGPNNDPQKIRTSFSPFYIVSGALSSLSLTLSSPLTSAFSRSFFSIRACSSASSESVTALGSILTTR